MTYQRWECNVCAHEKACVYFVPDSSSIYPSVGSCPCMWGGAIWTGPEEVTDLVQEKEFPPDGYLVRVTLPEESEVIDYSEEDFDEPEDLGD